MMKQMQASGMGGMGGMGGAGLDGEDDAPVEEDDEDDGVGFSSARSVSLPRSKADISHLSQPPPLEEA